MDSGALSPTYFMEISRVQRVFFLSFKVKYLHTMQCTDSKSVSVNKLPVMPSGLQPRPRSLHSGLSCKVQLWKSWGIMQMLPFLHKTACFPSPLKCRAAVDIFLMERDTEFAPGMSGHVSLSLCFLALSK